MMDFSSTSSPIEAEHGRRRRRSPQPAHLQLEPGEIVRKAVRPHWTSFMPAGVAVVAILSLPFALLRADVLNAGRTLLLLAVICALFAVFLSLAITNVRANETIITNRRLIIRKGFLDQQLREVPIGQITNVAASSDLIQGLTGCGNVTIDIGGMRGPEILPNVPDADGIVELLTHEVDAFEFGLTGGVVAADDRSPANPRPLSPVVDPLDRLRTLADLYKDGAITQEEYVTAKRHLLERL